MHITRTLAATLIAAAATVPFTATAAHADDQVTVTARWLVPAGYTEANANRVTQTLLGTAPVPCGRLAQVDTMVGTRAEIDAVMADGLLESGEDRHVTKSWTWEYGPTCEAPEPKPVTPAPVKPTPKPTPAPKPKPKPAPKLVTETYQVDVANLRSKAVVKAYLAADDDRKLGYRELAKLLGNKRFAERHEFVTIKVPAAATPAQRIAAINAKTKLGDVRTSKPAGPSKRARMTVVYAWKLDTAHGAKAKDGGAAWGPKRNLPQTFTARG